MTAMIDIHGQVSAWELGVSIHLEDEHLCCPDYSCCFPELLACPETRERYARAWACEDLDTVNELDADFLGQLIDHKYGGARA